MNDRSQIEISLKVFLQQLKSFNSSLPKDADYAELRDAVNYAILQSKKCRKLRDNSPLKCKRDIPTPCSDIDIPCIPKDLCTLSIPRDHFNIGLLSNNQDHRAVQETEGKEIDEIIFKLKQSESIKNFVQSGKRTSLHYAAYWASQTCVQTLILQGSDLTARDEYGLTPVIWACESDQLGNLITLMKAAKFQNIPENQWIYDSSGYHLIHHALYKDNRLKCLEYLSNHEYGLIVDKDDQSVLHYAAMNGFLNACKIILQCRSNIVLLNQFNKDSRTPLHLATINGHGNIVNFLLSQKANPYLCDKENHTPYYYANSKHLHFCLLIYERYNIKEKQNEKPTLDDNLLNELITFRPANPQFSHYQDFDINTYYENDKQRKSPSPPTSDNRLVKQQINKGQNNDTTATSNSSINNNNANQKQNSSSLLNKSIRRRLVFGTFNDNYSNNSKSNSVLVSRNNQALDRHISCSSSRLTDRSQHIEMNSSVSTDRQPHISRSNVKIKPELLPTDRRIHRFRNPLITAKQINLQSINKFQNSRLKPSISTLSSSSDYPEIDCKSVKHNEEISINGQSNNDNNSNSNSFRIDNRQQDQKHTSNLCSTIDPFKDVVYKSRTSDGSSISDTNSIPETETILYPTPCKLPFTQRIVSNNLTYESNSRLLRRRQVNSPVRDTSSIKNNDYISTGGELAQTSFDQHDEMIPLNLKMPTKQSTRISCQNKQSSYSLISPTFK
ncbi:unnamed protein product [Trichobilharzia szidati]|nr:unnamed protein product [Trichobilharzia szidati]